MFEGIFGLFLAAHQSYANNRKPAGIYLQFRLTSNRNLQRDHFVDQRLGYLKDGGARPEQLVQKERLNPKQAPIKLQNA